MSSGFSDLELTLILLSIPNIGPARYWKLIEAFGSPRAAFNAPIESLRVGFSATSFATFAEIRGNLQHEVFTFVDKTIAWCEQHDVCILHHSDEDYPARLREIAQAPPCLYVKGDTKILSDNQIAIVGSRSASQNGQNTAKRLASDLVVRGLVVTSGLALGIDGQAHQGALAGGGKTIAVVGTGVDQVYPYRHRQLANEILLSGGAIVSEFPLGTKARPQNFPRRNRIISGLSVGTVVVEAAVKSGSLITAKYALEQNREVFAMPGSVHSTLSRGCHTLIKQGAMLIEDAEDICNEILGLYEGDVTVSVSEPSMPKRETLEDKQERLVFDHIDYNPASIEEIAQRTGLNINDLLATLMNLELSGLLNHEGGRYVRAVKSSSA